MLRTDSDGGELRLQETKPNSSCRSPLGKNFWKRRRQNSELKIQTQRNNQVDNLSQWEGSVIQTIVHLPMAFQVFCLMYCLLFFLQMTESSIGSNISTIIRNLMYISWYTYLNYSRRIKGLYHGEWNRSYQYFWWISFFTNMLFK